MINDDYDDDGDITICKAISLVQFKRPRHFGLCRAAAHSDCCSFAPCTNILTYLLTQFQLHYGISGQCLK